MNILPQTNQLNTFVVAAPDPGTTLPELRALRAAWLTEALDAGYIDAARNIARWLGAAFDVPRRPTWKGYKFQDGNVTITLYEGPGDWQPGAKRFAERIRIVVTVGGLEAVNYLTIEGEPASVNNVFVPGQWLQALLEHQSQAGAMAEQAGRAAHEAERQDLARRLLVGKNV